MRRIRPGVAGLVAAAGLLLAACSTPGQGAPTGGTHATTDRVASGPAAEKDGGAGGKRTGEPRVPANPPAKYTPSWPDRTVRTKAGYQVDTCVPEDLRDKATTLTTGDGYHLSALVLGDGPDGVLLDHEQGYSICSWLETGQRLAAKGFRVLLPEYRSHGASEKDEENGRIDLDAEAALAELKRVGAERVFLAGASCGGTTAIVAGEAQPLPVTGLLIMSSPAVCHSVDAVPSVRRITAPSLFVVGSGDMEGAVEREVRTLYENSGARDKRLVVDDDGFHGTDMLRRGRHRDRMVAMVTEFVEKHARG
ncbi:alpha/beta hydrolase [Streptomyces sp. NPDC008313]|uniref:alpha/beta hydrolase n=1 Tax=Streptomyces sp. NPDC008313 TaxID=3364826 RepID=UPI0036E11339